MVKQVKVELTPQFVNRFGKFDPLAGVRGKYPPNGRLCKICLELLSADKFWFDNFGCRVCRLNRTRQVALARERGESVVSEYGKYITQAQTELLKMMVLGNITKPDEDSVAEAMSISTWKASNWLHSEKFVVAANTVIDRYKLGVERLPQNWFYIRRIEPPLPIRSAPVGSDGIVYRYPLQAKDSVPGRRYFDQGCLTGESCELLRVTRSGRVVFATKETDTLWSYQESYQLLATDDPDLVTVGELDDMQECTIAERGRYMRTTCELDDQDACHLQDVSTLKIKSFPRDTICMKIRSISDKTVCAPIEKPYNHRVAAY